MKKDRGELIGYNGCCGYNYIKYEHSIRVAKTSQLLAEKWGVLTSDAVLLHDIGKSMSKQQMLSLCVRKNTTVESIDNVRD